MGGITRSDTTVLLVNPDGAIERCMGRHFGRLGWVMPPMGLLCLAAATLGRAGLDPQELFGKLPSDSSSNVSNGNAQVSRDQQG
jgi:hypothetical protein